MFISISNCQIDSVKSSVGFYISQQAKDPNAMRTMEWLCAMCNFYEDLQPDDGKQNTAIEVSPMVAQCLPEMVQKYIFTEIDGMSDCDFGWLCEMVHIYQQICDNEIPFETPSLPKKKHEDDNAGIDGQEQQRTNTTQFKDFSPDSFAVEDKDLSEDDYVDLSQPEDELF